MLQEIDNFGSVPLPTLRYLTLDRCILTEQEIGNIVRAFPAIEDLDIDQSVPDIYAMLGTGTSGECPPWPQLQTLSLRELEPSDALLVCYMITSRATAGKGLMKVRLDKRSRNVLRAKDRLDWMRGVVEVENCDYLDPWPLDLEVYDPYDNWD